LIQLDAGVLEKLEKSLLSLFSLPLLALDLVLDVLHHFFEQLDQLLL